MIKNETKFYIERNFFHEKIYEIYFEFMNTVDESESIENCYYYMTKNMSFEEFYHNFTNQNSLIQFNKIRKIFGSDEFGECSISDFKLIDQNNDEVIETLLSHKSLQIDLDEVLEEANKTKIFILSSEAGTGKTVIFQQIAIRFKNKSPELWVSYINLKDFRNFYKNVETLDDVKKLLQNIFDLNSKTEFEKKLFEEYFITGKTVLVWNGFDEIFPEYSKVVLNTLKIIKRKTQNIQFICTRTSYSGDIVRKFFTKSYTIVPFDKKDQDIFLKKFYISSNIKDETKIENYIEKIRKKIDSTAFEDDFSTPLLLGMIAASVSDDRQSFENENLFEIYESFVETKIRNFLKMTTNLTSIDDMNKIHQKYALMTIPDTFAYSLNIKNLQIMKFQISKNITNDKISSMQVLDINERNIFKFAHKTYAEFFVAQYLIQNIYNLKSHEKVSIDELDYRLRVFCGSLEYPKIKSFIFNFLQTKSAKRIEKFQPEISNLLKTKFERIFINTLSRHGMNMIPILLNFFKKDYELLVDLLHVHENKTFSTELLNYANAAFINIETLNINQTNEFIKPYLNNTDYRELLGEGKNQKGILMFSSYCYYKKNGVCWPDGKSQTEHYFSNNSG